MTNWILRKKYGKGGRKTIFEKIMAENFLESMKNMN